MFVFLVPYRAKNAQTFRRNQIITMMENVKTYFTKHNIEYKIVIMEQNDINYFNRGLLLNAAFLEGEKLETDTKKYLHFNVDYVITLDRPFPQEFLNDIHGFIDLHRPAFPVLGAACVFDPESYRKCNGFPNDLEGWGGDDWAIYNRIVEKGIPCLTPAGLSNSGFVTEDSNMPVAAQDPSQNDKNIRLASRKDTDNNGVSTCVYTIDGNGEFHNGVTIYHYLISWIR